MTHFEFASSVGAVYDRAFFFSSITSSGCYEKSCAVIDRAYKRRKFKVGPTDMADMGVKLTQLLSG